MGCGDPAYGYVCQNGALFTYAMAIIIFPAISIFVIENHPCMLSLLLGQPSTIKLWVSSCWLMYASNVFCEVSEWLKIVKRIWLLSQRIISAYAKVFTWDGNHLVDQVNDHRTSICFFQYYTISNITICDEMTDLSWLIKSCDWLTMHVFLTKATPETQPFLIKSATAVSSLGCWVQQAIENPTTALSDSVTCFLVPGNRVFRCYLHSIRPVPCLSVLQQG